MFKFLSSQQQLVAERKKNEALQAIISDLENAAIELAEIITEKEESINNG